MGTLNLSANNVAASEPVEITATVSNTGGESGTYRVTFKVNGVTESTRDVLVAAGGNEQVTFTTSQSMPGSYTVDVNGLTGAFTVSGAAAPPEDPGSSATVLNVILVLAGISAGIIAYLIWRRRHYHTA